MVYRGRYHEIETGHEQNEIGEQQPVLVQGNLAFCDESTGYVATRFPCRIPFQIGLCLGKAQAEDDDEDRRTGTEPEQRSPAVRSRPNKGACEDRCQEISKRISLLQHSRNDTSVDQSVFARTEERGLNIPRLFWTIL